MIRLGVIGYGARLHGMVSVFREVDSDIKITGIVDPNEKSVRTRLAATDQQDVVFYKNLKEMVRHAKLDALAIGTRCNLHTPYAVEAARCALPLFLEKPVAISMQQAVTLERAFTKSKCEVVVSFPLRVSPLCVLTRQYLDDGAVGHAEHILAVNYVPYATCYFDMDYRNYAITQGLFLQKATHDFDYMSYLMKSPIVRVAAMAVRGHVFGGSKPAGLVCSQCKAALKCLESPTNRKRNLSGGMLDDHPCTFGIECGTPATGMNEDCSSALIEFANGAQGVYTQVFFTRRDAATRGATISGYHGTVGFDWYTNQIKRVRHHAPFSDLISGQAGMSHFGGDLELARDFVGLIKGTTNASRTPISSGLASVYACLAAKESSEKGRFVNVRQLGCV